MAKQMLASIRYVPMHATSGLPIDDAPLLGYETARINRVLSKIVRGLYYETFRKPLPLENEVFVELESERSQLDGAVAQIVMAGGSGRVIGDDTFAYKIAELEETPGAGACVMAFFGTILNVSTFITPAMAALLRARDDMPL